MTKRAHGANEIRAFTEAVVDADREPGLIMKRAPDEPEAERLTRADVLSTAEVAELLGIPRSTVHHLARQGELLAPATRPCSALCAPPNATVCRAQAWRQPTPRRSAWRAASAPALWRPSARHSCCQCLTRARMASSAETVPFCRDVVIRSIEIVVPRASSQHATCISTSRPSMSSHLRAEDGGISGLAELAAKVGIVAALTS